MKQSEAEEILDLVRKVNAATQKLVKVECGFGSKFDTYASAEKELTRTQSQLRELLYSKVEMPDKQTLDLTTLDGLEKNLASICDRLELVVSKVSSAVS